MGLNQRTVLIELGPIKNLYESHLRPSGVRTLSGPLATRKNLASIGTMPRIWMRKPPSSVLLSRRSEQRYHHKTVISEESGGPAHDRHRICCGRPSRRRCDTRSRLLGLDDGLSVGAMYAARPAIHWPNCATERRHCTTYSTSTVCDILEYASMGTK